MVLKCLVVCRVFYVQEYTRGTITEVNMKVINSQLFLVPNTIFMNELRDKYKNCFICNAITYCLYISLSTSVY